MSRIRILIADDHAVVREGLARMLGDQPDLRVVAEAEDGSAALAAALSCDPHVALLDLRMPGLGGVAAIKKLREQCPGMRILVLSMYEEQHYQRAALSAGAHAYLSKRASSQTLLATIRRLHAGQTLESEDPPAPSGDAEALSVREREILRMTMQGQTGREIADVLGISKSSVDTYRARLFRKLGVTNRSELFARVGQTDLE